MDSWSLLYMINLANISPTSFLTKTHQYFTSGLWFTNHLLRSLSSSGMISLSPLTACLCQSSSESSLDLEGKSHSGAHSLIGFIVCLSKWAKNSLCFFFSLPNFLCVGDVTSRQPHTGISGELGIYWDFTVRILVSASLIGKRRDPCRMFLEGECREM